jgi:hypothetical protein
MSSSKEKNIGFIMFTIIQEKQIFPKHEGKTFHKLNWRNTKTLMEGKNRNNFKIMKFNNEMEIFPLKLFSKFSLS